MTAKGKTAKRPQRTSMGPLQERDAEKLLLKAWKAGIKPFLKVLKKSKRFTFDGKGLVECVLSPSKSDISTLLEHVAPFICNTMKQDKKAAKRQAKADAKTVKKIAKQVKGKSKSR